MRALAPTLLVFTVSATLTFSAASQPRDESDRFWRPELQIGKRIQPEGEPELDVDARGTGGGLVVPRYAVDSECREAYGNKTGANLCIRNEQSSYNYLIAIWDNLSVDSKIKCRETKTDAPVRYTQMKACAIAEIQKIDLNQLQHGRAQFRY